MPCCPGLLWEASHVKRLEKLVTRQILVPSYGIFSSRLSRRPFSSSALSYRAFSDKRYLHHSILKNWWQGRFFFWLTAHSRPGRPALLVQCLIIRGFLPSRLQRASWFRRLASSRPNFLHSERPLDGAACFFHWQIFVTDLRSAQVMSPVNRWPLQRTHAREKLIAPSGNWTQIAQLRIQSSTSRPQVAPAHLLLLVRENVCYLISIFQLVGSL